MIFKSQLFFLLIPVLVVVAFFLKKIKIHASIVFSSEKLLRGIKPSLKSRLAANIFILRIFILCLIIFALARPQAPVEESKIQTEGIDIVLAIDTSTSMLAEDFTLGGRRVNRLDAVKDVVENFIKGRNDDRIGIIIFAAQAYMVSPLTFDYNWLLQNLERIKIGMVEDGTALGVGLASALNRLKDTEAKSKVIILLTDGRNNTGNISPTLASEAAKALGVKVYTIGAGKKGLAPYPVKDFFGNRGYQQINVDIDEDTLKDIAVKTQGKYFRATDIFSLRKIYAEINELEKTPIEDRGYSEYRELFPLFLFPGLILLFLEIVLSNTVLRRIP